MGTYLPCPICGTAHAGVTPEGHAREQECSQCGKTLPLDAFPVHASAWNGHRKTCTSCLAPGIAAEKAALKARRQEKAAILAIPAHRPADITYHELYASRDDVSLTAGLLYEQDALVLDSETTGLNPRYDRLVSLCVVRLASGETVLDTLINPRRPIPAEASSLHHIYDSDVVEAPTWYSVWKYELFPLLERSPHLVIFNARFDMGFITAAVAQLRERFPSNAPVPPLQVYCAMKMAARWNDGRERISLKEACERRVIHLPEARQHSASGDAQATRELLLSYAHELRPDIALPAPAVTEATPPGTRAVPDVFTFRNTQDTRPGSLRWALEHSPTHEADNPNVSQGIYPIMGAKQLPSGSVEVLVYMLEGEYSTRAYATPEDASASLFSDYDGAYWSGDTEWYPVMPIKREETPA